MYKMSVIGHFLFTLITKLTKKTQTGQCLLFSDDSKITSLLKVIGITLDKKCSGEVTKKAECTCATNFRWYLNLKRKSILRCFDTNCTCSTLNDGPTRMSPLARFCVLTLASCLQCMHGGYTWSACLHRMMTTSRQSATSCGKPKPPSHMICIGKILQAKNSSPCNLGWQCRQMCLSATPLKGQTFLSVADMSEMSSRHVGGILLCRPIFQLSASCRYHQFPDTLSYMHVGISAVLVCG